jgi:hypothetical protein
MRFLSKAFKGGVPREIDQALVDAYMAVRGIALFNPYWKSPEDFPIRLTREQRFYGQQ